MPSIPLVQNKGLRVDNAVTVFIGGKSYTGWKSMSIRRDLTAVSGSFSFSVFDKWRQLEDQWPIKPGSEVRIFIGTQKVITGYIDDLEAQFSPDERSITITGREKTGDLVDCTAPAEPGELKNVTILGIANKLIAPFGVSAVVDTGVDIGSSFSSWTIKQGETVFENLDRAAKQRGLLLISNADGNLVITSRGSQTTPTELTLGVNIKTGSASYSMAERYSEYTVKGQAQGTDDIDEGISAGSKGTATDPTVGRYRPITIINEANTDSGVAAKRAQWEATFRAANSIKVTAEVVTWFRPDGLLWKVNELIPVTIPFLGLTRRKMLINSLEFKKNDQGGTTTTFSLTRPDAYETKPEVDSSPAVEPILALGHK